MPEVGLHYIKLRIYRYMMFQMNTIIWILSLGGCWGKCLEMNWYGNISSPLSPCPLLYCLIWSKIVITTLKSILRRIKLVGTIFSNNHDHLSLIIGLNRSIVSLLEILSIVILCLIMLSSKTSVIIRQLRVKVLVIVWFLFSRTHD